MAQTNQRSNRDVWEIDITQSPDEQDIVFLTAKRVEGRELYASARVKPAGKGRRIELSRWQTEDGAYVYAPRLTAQARRALAS